MSFIDLGPIARQRLGMQAQYAVRYVTGTHGAPDLGHGLRFSGDVSQYHCVQVHSDDVDEFVRRVQRHRRATGQIGECSTCQGMGQLYDQHGTGVAPQPCPSC